MQLAVSAMRASNGIVALSRHAARTASVLVAPIHTVASSWCCMAAPRVPSATPLPSSSPSVAAATAATAVGMRSLHSSSRLDAVLDEQTLKQAAQWNLAARLGTIDDILDLERWLKTFKRDSIPSATFEIKHARSSGSGGQNVNKVNTKVDLRFKLDNANWMPLLARKCLKELERGRINASGEFVVTSERTRTQGENFEDCIDKIYAMIVKACELPKATDAAKIDRIKKLADAQKQRRREHKTYQSDKKASRRNWRD